MKSIKLNNFEIGGDKLTVLAGPCAIESEEVVFETAKKLKEITEKLNINYVFKASFDKANRSSIKSFRGIGIKEGIEVLKKVKHEFGLPIVTDVHTVEQVDMAKNVADIIQIPAFLCRQTDLVVKAGETGKIVNIKKGQFLAPEQAKPLIEKVKSTGNDKVLITERGTTFGYNNLVVDMRAIKIIQDLGYPVVFDATHSVQLPGVNNESTGGDRRFVPLLAKAAVAAGCRALFFEVHPDPKCALCDGDNMIALSQAEEIFDICNKIFKVVQN